MLLRCFRTLSLLLLLCPLLLGSIKEVAAQKKERVGRHSPAYMRSVLYLYSNRGQNSVSISYLGKSAEKQALFGGYNIRHVHRAFDMDLYDYRGLVKRQPKMEAYAKIKNAIGVRDIIVIAIEGIDVSHYKAITPELYPFDKESPDVKILYYDGVKRNKVLLAVSCKGLPTDKKALELKLALMDCGNIDVNGNRVVFLPRNSPAFNPSTGNLYGLGDSLFVRTSSPKFIAWVKDQGLSVSPKGNLSVSWGALKKGAVSSAP